jgi:hypothetical protein
MDFRASATLKRRLQHARREPVPPHPKPLIGSAAPDRDLHAAPRNTGRRKPFRPSTGFVAISRLKVNIGHKYSTTIVCVVTNTTVYKI